MITEAIALIVAAFTCELIDSSLGMCYGTILSPLLLIAGYEPLAVVPSILFSQAIGGLVASRIHHALRNVDFSIESGVMKRLEDLGYIESFRRSTSRDLKVVFVVTTLGVIATVIATLTAISVPKTALKTYIGILILAMGIVLLLRSRFEFSWRRILGIGVLSAFNKGISGGGFGPVVTSGQMMCGRRSRNSIGATALSEAPICIVGFLTYLIRKGIPRWDLVLLLSLGAIVGAIIGPHITAKFKAEEKIRVGLGILVTLLGLWTLVKTWLI